MRRRREPEPGAQRPIFASPCALRSHFGALAASADLRSDQLVWDLIMRDIAKCHARFASYF